MKTPATRAGAILKKTMKRMKELVITTLFSVITGLAGWIAGRRKNVAQTRTIELDNIEKAVEIWRQLAESYAEKLQVMQADINKISIENYQLRQSVDQIGGENDKLKRSMNQLGDENNKLKAEIDSLRKKIAVLSCDNKRLDKKIEVYSSNIKDNEGNDKI